MRSTWTAPGADCPHHPNTGHPAPIDRPPIGDARLRIQTVPLAT